ncbi:MAG: putative NAD-dependent epimerase/dehydratase family protein [Cyclobacteriaceae bacterium]|jgi:uncharacterized NAD-dependent epimerase/dehydratase family protein
MDQPHISGKAVLITGGLLNSINAKTAHGLLRVSNRFEIIGVIDEKHAGKDAGIVVDGQELGIPVAGSISSFVASNDMPKYAIIGMATKGGVLPKDLYSSIKEILSMGIHVVNGLHEPLAEIAEFREVAYEYGDIIYDIRKSKPFKELHFWTGKVKEITATKIAVLGTDCALGKRTTSRMLEAALIENGLKAEMIYTGQTGWMQGANYGFLFDATANDFISGELEHALYQCWKNEKVDVLIMEGQSGLRNPSGPCGSEFIISGAADGVILQHSPVRSKFKGMENYPSDMPDILDEVELIERLGSKVIALTINTQQMNEEDVKHYRAALAKRTDIPFVFPFFDSLAPIVQVVKNLNKK